MSKKKKISPKKPRLADKNPINLALARKVLGIVSQGLSDGLDDGTIDDKGRPAPGHMCVEAAVCFALGQPHGDDPKCVDGDVRDYKIALNDNGEYDDNDDRAQKLKRIAIAQLGSRDLAKGSFMLGLRRALAPLLRAEVGNSVDIKANDVVGVVGKQIVAFIDKGELTAAFDLAGDAIERLDIIDTFPDGLVFERGCGECIADAMQEYKGTDFAIQIGIEALRLAGSPGVKLMDRLIAAKEL